MTKLEEIALARMSAEVPAWARKMIEAEGGAMAGVRADARRMPVHDRPGVGADRPRAHDAEAREAVARLARQGSGPTVITPRDRAKLAPRGF